MNEENIRSLLKNIAEGLITVDDGFDILKDLPFESLKNANIDHHRQMRVGQPEVVYGKDKHISHLLEITASILNKKSNLLITKLQEEKAEVILKEFPNLNYNKEASAVFFEANTVEKKGLVAVVSAGTSDIGVVEEALLTLSMLGNNTIRIVDVGVAGIHRLFAHINEIKRANAVIVVAGMEGALASVVGGLTDANVIAVPTSVGYGASFNGLAALLGMLNSCSPNVSVMNIDNGFSAGFYASIINRKISHAKDS